MASETPREREVLLEIFRMTQQVDPGGSLEQLPEMVATAACRFTRADSCAVLVFDETGDTLRRVASHGLNPTERDATVFRLGEGIAGWVAQHGKPLAVPDVREDPRFKLIPAQETEILSMGCLPLRTHHGPLGVISVNSRRVGTFTPAHMDFLTSIAATIVTDIDNSRLYHMAVTDDLTGAYSRQYLAEALPAEIRRHRRYRRPLAVLLVDADHFADINDSHGVEVGDAVVTGLAEHLIVSVREVDAVVRFGGDEFLVIMPETAMQEAVAMAERLRSSLAITPLRTPAGELTITASVVVGELGSPDEEMGGLLERVDGALQAAKEAGRNQVVVA